MKAPTDAPRIPRTTQATPLLSLPDPKMDLGFPPVHEAGKLGQGHNDAFKKVTAPTGIVSMKHGFRPSPAVNPRDHRIRRKEPPLAYHRREASQNLAYVEQEVLPSPPWPYQRNWTWRSTPPGIISRREMLGNIRSIGRLDPPVFIARNAQHGWPHPNPFTHDLSPATRSCAARPSATHHRP
jgi:hypothetical protein